MTETRCNSCPGQLGRYIGRYRQQAKHAHLQLLIRCPGLFELLPREVAQAKVEDVVSPIV